MAITTDVIMVTMENMVVMATMEITDRAVRNHKKGIAGESSGLL